MAYKTFVLEPAVAIPVLYSMLRKRGVKFVEKRLESFDDLVAMDK